MSRGVANQALELARVLEQAAEDRVLLRLGQFRHHADGLVESHVQLGRHQLGQVVDVTQGDVERATDVADHGPGLHRAEGDDLGHVVLAVALRHIVDDPVAVPVVEVDVDVGHRDPLAIEEALEDQAVTEGIGCRDAQRVADDAPGRRATPGPHGDAVRARVVDEIADDQEVSRVAHLLDDAELGLEALLDDRRDLRVAAPQALLGEAAEVAVGGLSRGNLEARQEWMVVEFQVATLGDAQGVGHRLRVVAELRRHLLGRFQIELVVVEAHALGIGDDGPGLEAEQDVVRLCVLLPRVVRVVGHHQRDAGLA